MKGNTSSPTVSCEFHHEFIKQYDLILHMKHEQMIVSDSKDWSSGLKLPSQFVSLFSFVLVSRVCPLRSEITPSLPDTLCLLIGGFPPTSVWWLVDQSLYHPLLCLDCSDWPSCVVFSLWKGLIRRIPLVRQRTSSSRIIPAESQHFHMLVCFTLPQFITAVTPWKTHQIHR